MATLVSKKHLVFKYFRLPTLVLILMFFALGVKSLIAANMESDESAAYANFIQNLVNKSTISKKGAFCIFGNDPVARALKNGSRNVAISQNLDEVKSKCRAVYVSSANATKIKLYLSGMAQGKILTISTFEEFIDNGGMIQVEMGRRDFELIVDVKLLHAAQIKLDTLSTNLIIN